MAIFKKTNDDQTPEASPAPPKAQPRPAQPKNVTVIGSTLVIKGELSADEDLVIEGQIEGKIAHHKKNLTVGEKGRVKADIHASAVVVLGQLIGDIHSDGTVSLAKGSDVRGNIFCANIVMENGARFTGQIDMGDSSAVKTAAGKPVQAEKVIEPEKAARTEKPAPTEPGRKEKPQTTSGQTAKSSLY